MTSVPPPVLPNTTTGLSPSPLLNPPTPWQRLYRRMANRRIAMSGYAVAFVLQWVLWGLPVDVFLIFAWLLAATLCWNIAQPWRYHLAWVRDWGPILGLLLVYNVSRGFADQGTTGRRLPHVTEMINVDRALFGGELPTAWLQHHFFDPDHAHWWDVAVSFIYMSHFVLSLGLAIVLWLKRRALWASFMRRWFALTAMGVTTYFLYPAAPPWWAEKAGVLHENIVRISTRGWQAIGLGNTGTVLNSGQHLANQVAAMPSLHSAFALLAAVFIGSLVAKKWWPLLAVYPIAMGLTLVYSGEHYVTDVLVGWAYVVIVWLAVAAAERWWRSRQQNVMPQEAAVAQEQAPVTSAVANVGLEKVLEPSMPRA